MIRRLARIVDDAESGPREVTSAAKAILSASQINLANVSTSIKALEHIELETRVREVESRIAMRNAPQITSVARYGLPALSSQLPGGS